VPAHHWFVLPWPNEAKVYAELCTIVDEWIVTMRRDGAPLPRGHVARAYSGKIPLRLAPELHKAVAIRASRAGESVNAYVAHCLSKAVEK
jgi:predicted HicB family RNase H-like nuclease